MRRLCTDSSCSYSGRSAPHAICAAMGVELRAILKGMESPPNPTAAVVAMGAGLWATAKAVERPPDLTVTRTARPAATLGVMGQKSTDGVVAKRPP